MDNFKLLPILASILALGVVGNAMRLPEDDKAVAAEGPESSKVEESERATWLSTRQMEDDFKDIVFLAIQELANEGRIDPSIVRQTEKVKRGRYQGFCFRKTSSGRFLPYICWKGDRK